MKGYKEIPADRMPGNVIEMIGRQWMLVTAGSGEQCNTMTASWGGIGVIWGQPAATVYIRPQRYTREFVDAEPRLTLSFMGEEYRRALAYCGAHRGEDCPGGTDRGAYAGRNALHRRCRNRAGVPQDVPRPVRTRGISGEGADRRVVS